MTSNQVFVGRGGAGPGDRRGAVPQQHTGPWEMHTRVLGLASMSVDVPKTGDGHPKKDILKRSPPRQGSLRAGLWAGCRTGPSWLPVVAPSPSQALGCGTTAQRSSSLFFPLMKTLLQETQDGHIPLGSTEHLAEGDSATQPHITEGHRALLGKFHACHILDQQHINGAIWSPKLQR